MWGAAGMGGAGPKDALMQRCIHSWNYCCLNGHSCLICWISSLQAIMKSTIWMGYEIKISNTTAFDFESDYLSNEREQQTFESELAGWSMLQDALPPSPSPCPWYSGSGCWLSRGSSPRAGLWGSHLALPPAPHCVTSQTQSPHLLCSAWGLAAGLWIARNLSDSNVYH